MGDLDLREGDFVYISPLIPSDDGHEQAEALRRMLTPSRARGVRIATYDIRQIVY